MIHPLLPMPELTKESDAVYAILGPALAYATEFENNCLTLAHLFDIEKSDSEFSYEIYKLVNSGTLHEKIKLLVDEHGLPDWVEEKIHEARNARNFIAHEAAQDHKRMMSTPQLIKNFETTIMLMTGKIAHGNQIVLEVTRMLKEGKRRCRCIFICYGVVDWPCRLLIRHCSRKISDCVLTLPLSTTLGERRKFLVSLEVRKNKDAYLSVFLCKPLHS
ncbi:hypothetical protein P0C28_08175 [Aeromonas hydrophila]|uniref:hypothetical protein n=1 Tax=Aeromonas hydrophila TaxID=644 RepID=UPI0023AE8FCF|nr:hypothetical protein [Aeromonas hydrophila]MDE8809238.1 hypothetical protein [Aeromonas hydrophila]